MSTSTVHYLKDFQNIEKLFQQKMFLINRTKYTWIMACFWFFDIFSVVGISWSNA